MSARLSVLLPLALEAPYDYLPSENGADAALTEGQFVKVPLRHKEVVGVVWPSAQERPALALSKLRRVISVLDLPPLPSSHCAFIDWVADYTLAPKGAVLKLTMNTSSVFRPISARAKKPRGVSSSTSKPDFSDAQVKAGRAHSPCAGAK